MIQQIDAFAVRLARVVLRRRWWVIAAVVASVFALASGSRHIEFSNNYRVFFGKENPELLAFENFQATYTKNDNILIVIQPADHAVFRPRVTEAVETITRRAWKIPYAIRVDSISNFQYSWADGDDLTVEDLIRNSHNLDPGELARKEALALAEPLLRNSLISQDADTTGINVTLQYPEQSINEVPEAVNEARRLVADIKAQYPDLTVALTGISMLNHTFAEAGVKDLQTLVPLMYLILIGVMILTLRSMSGTVASLLVIGFSSATAVGLAGYIGIRLTPISAIAPTIILTLAIADSIHILVTLRKQMQLGLDKHTALVESIRINTIPVAVTSLTTAVGFLGLNFSDTPPFHDLGNITAMGIMAAWVYAMTFLPALVSLIPFKVHMKSVAPGAHSLGPINRLAAIITRQYKPIGVVVGVLSLFTAFMVPRIELNDEWIKYFDHRVSFRNDAEFALDHLTGLYNIEYSVPAGGEGNVSNAEYLNHLEGFTEWLRSQPEVIHVYSYADIIKRLNKNMHADDPAWYRIPQERQLAAQYLLLYELSLPFGLDLNDRISVDKSATRVTVSLPEISTARVREFIHRSKAWLSANTPPFMHTDPTGATVMFSYISERNIKSMVKGNILALALIAGVIAISLGSLTMGLLSLIPNMFPILITFGLWALTVGQVGMAAATVTSTSLGIIVDDTVHFLAKYLRARRELGLDKPNAVKYAFDSVGSAIIATSIILGIGFAILAMSTFLINSQMGLLTALAIVIALVFDFTILPALLLMGKKTKGETYELEYLSHKTG
jgi:predicted RND superfamily exporter protein